MIKYQSRQEAGISNEEWDNYIRNSNNGTIFQEQSFLSYHPEERFKDLSLFFAKRDKIIALLTLTIKKDNMLSSHQGASFGGFVYQKPLTANESQQICEGLLEYAQKLQVNGIEMTLPPSVYCNTPNDTILFYLWQAGFRYSRRELTNILKIKEEFNFDRSVRKAVNHSSELRIVDNDTNYEAFYKLLTENLMAKGAKPTHSFTELMDLKEKYPQKIVFWGAYLNDKFVGGLCNWEVKTGFQMIFYSCYDKDYGSHRILNRLFYDCCLLYQKQGIKFVDFGTSSKSMVLNQGLNNFKELYEAYGVFRDTLVLEIVK